MFYTSFRDFFIVFLLYFYQYYDNVFADGYKQKSFQFTVLLNKEAERTLQHSPFCAYPVIMVTIVKRSCSCVLCLYNGSDKCDGVFYCIHSSTFLMFETQSAACISFLAYMHKHPFILPD